MRLPRIAWLALPVLAACASKPARSPNPACQSFDVEHSDPQAIAIADEVMEALGGRRAWDETRCIEWTHAGRRRLLWDKHTGDFRLDDGRETVLMNIHTGLGRVFEDGREITHDPEKVRHDLDAAYRVWATDSYWMFAPYKLKDSGVTLTWEGVRNLPDGRVADLLRLEFENVGVTPENAYEMWVARDTHRVEQWSFFRHRDDKKPRITTPWADWREHGRIWLAESHGDGPTTTDIAVYDEPPERLKKP
jgi:hypothetical protein